MSELHATNFDCIEVKKNNVLATKQGGKYMSCNQNIIQST